MRIAVVGAGGTGGLFGGLLARAGHDVRFLARGATLAALKKSGLEVRSKEFGTFHVNAPASADPAELGKSALVLFMVKTYDLESALPAAAALLEPEGSILTVQNGLEAPDQVAAVVGPEHVLIGTTVVETTILEPGVIVHLSPAHSLAIARFDGPPTPDLDQLVTTFKAAGLNASAAQNGRIALWEKAAPLIPLATANSVFLEPIGPIRDDPRKRAVLERLVIELEAVARASGYDLPDLGQRSLAHLDRLPPTMKASMARDFERGNRTELEALTGAIVRLGQQHGVEVPATLDAYTTLKARDRQSKHAAEAMGSPRAAQ